MKFRKRPVVIEATQITQAMLDAYVLDAGPLPDGLVCVGASYHSVDRKIHSSSFGVRTLEGFMSVVDGDWLITGVKGERYPCKPDIFELTYEALPSESVEK